MSLSSSNCSAKETLRMFPSSSNGINYPTPFFTHIDSPNSKHEHLQLLDPSDDFFIPCYDEMISLHEETPVVDFVNNTGDNEMKEIPTAKRCSKKDRHSKINTAQGPRDRRMRLSLKVAREFFDLQDQLCFDKASKTIEWLLIQASSAIEQLSGTGTVNQNASSASECQVVEEDKETPRAAKTTACRKGKRAKPSRCPRVKELRAEARAKARERATEKRRREEIAAQSHYFYPATSARGSISGDQSLEAMEKWSPFPGLSHLYYPGFPQLQNEMEDVEFCKSMWE